MLQGGGETWVVLDEGVVRVEEDQVHEGGVRTGGGEPILVVHLHYLQVLHAVVTAGVKRSKEKIIAGW